MKTKIKNCVFWVLGVSFLLLNGCSEEIYENHLHSEHEKNDNSISFNSFLNETNLKDFKNTKRFTSTNIEGVQSRLIGSEFYIDTTRIFRYSAPNNKVTYSFRAFPLSGTVEPNSYYNIVYEQIGTQWNEVIFLNKEKSNPTDASKLESSNMIYNRLSSHGALGFTEVITTTIQCNGSCSGACDGFACPTGECIKTTVTYVYTGIADTGGGFNGNGTDPGSGNTGGSGGGDAYGGIFIPNPYSNNADPNDPDFILDGQISSFINFLAIQNPNIATLLSTNLWLHPHINQFIRDNGGLNFANKTAVRNALETLQLVTAIDASNFNSNIYQLYVDTFLFLLQNPDAANKTFVLEMIDISIKLDINALEVWGDLEMYRNRMSSQELVIFDNMLPNRRMWYLVSAKKASELSFELFPNSSLNGKGDALRHALWNGFSSLTIGQDLTTQLTNAHELSPNNRPFPWKEKEMDIYNNQKGRSIALYSNISNIATNIIQAHTNGNLVYLNNLEIDVAIKGWATIFSVLTPTNQ